MTNDLPAELAAIATTLKGTLSLLKSYKFTDTSSEDSVVDPIWVLNSVFSTSRLLHTGITFDDNHHSLRSREGVYLCRGDGSPLREAFRNVIKNAAEAIAERFAADSKEGIITIESTELSPSEILIAISDNGIGMPPDTLQRLYTAGFSTKDSDKGHMVPESALTSKSKPG